MLEEHVIMVFIGTDKQIVLNVNPLYSDIF